MGCCSSGPPKAPPVRMRLVTVALLKGDPAFTVNVIGRRVACTPGPDDGAGRTDLAIDKISNQRTVGAA